MTDVTEPHVWQVDADVRPLPDKVLVCDMEHGDKITRGGIIIPDDTAVERGIRPRWATVYRVGSDVTCVKPGDRILISHGRWTRGIKIRNSQGGHQVIRMVESDSILGVDETA